MKQIPLFHRKTSHPLGLRFALVDDQDYEWLSKWKWTLHSRKHATGFRLYAYRFDYSSGKPKCVIMHREIAAKSGMSDVDHKDHDGLNNQRENLRPCTRTQNNGNKRKSPGTTSQYKGVSWSKDRQMWQAHISINNKSISLGRYYLEHMAALAYKLAAEKAFGEFAHAPITS